MIFAPNYTDTYPIKQLDSHRLSDDEFFEFCQLNDHLKIERDTNGNILLMALTGGKTGKANFELSIEFGIWNRKDKKGVAFDSSTGFKLSSGAVRSPDLAWVSNADWNKLSAEEQGKFPPVCPYFVVEIMSSSDYYPEAKLKMEEWRESGCQLGWLINLKNNEVHIYHADGGVSLHENFDTPLQGEGLISDFQLDLSILI